MSTTQLGRAVRCRGSATIAGPGLLALMLLVAGGAGCGPALEEAGSEQPETQTAALESDEASGGEAERASANGITVNGITVNGITVNGITVNGLTTAAVNSARFTQWFRQDPEASDLLMQYVTRCGLKQGKRIRYTAPDTGITYTWEGLLNLTPRWASGRKASKKELELMTACLAAHANKYGQHVPLSILGENAEGDTIDFTWRELVTYSRHEGCFFGNLFDDGTIFVGSDRDYLDPAESTARACALNARSPGMSTECPPFVHIGRCENICRLHRSGLYYESCTYQGKHYRPLTTRLRPEDVYRCGDGVCQFTEQCGTGNTWDSCRSDCGTCPAQ
ncbi:hypothetical protein P2318_20525 [Myxococcaceae bacterium GXIMD 01537]